VLAQPLGRIEGVERARTPKRLAVLHEHDSVGERYG
jgi:hypothetical protein